MAGGICAKTTRHPEHPVRFRHISLAGRSPGLRISGFPGGGPAFPAYASGCGRPSPVTVAGAAAFGPQGPRHSLFTQSMHFGHQLCRSALEGAMSQERTMMQRCCNLFKT